METIRDVSIQTVVRELEMQKIRKRDMVVPASWLAMSETGNIIINESGDKPLPEEMQKYLESCGITYQTQFNDFATEYHFTPTRPCETQIADKLNIPFRYYERMKQEAGALLKNNVDYWLRNNGSGGKNYFLRTFAPKPGEDLTIGIARAFLGERFNIIDHLDILMTVLETLQNTGTNIKITGSDITDKRLYVRFTFPDIAIKAPELLRTYRSPDMNRDDGIFAGFTLSNSETGHGKFKITPRIIVAACRNGMLFEKDALGVVHVGSKMDTGVIDYGEDTKQKEMELITLQARDAVKHFASSDYLKTIVNRLEGIGTRELEYPVQAVTNICNSLALNEERTQNVLNYFSLSGDITTFGAVQSLTYHAQHERDADLAYDLEANAVPIMETITKYDKLPPPPRKKSNYNAPGVDTAA